MQNLSLLLCAFKPRRRNFSFSFWLCFLFSFSLLGKLTGFFPLGVVGERRELDCLGLQACLQKSKGRGIIRRVWCNLKASSSSLKHSVSLATFPLVAFLRAWKDVRTGFGPKGSVLLYSWCECLYIQNLNLYLPSFPPNSDIHTKLSSWALAQGAANKFISSFIFLINHSGASAVLHYQEG